MTIPTNPDLEAWAERVAGYKSVDFTAAELVAAWMAEGFVADVPARNWRPGKPPVCRKSVEHSIANAAQIVGAVAKRSDLDFPDLAALSALEDAVAQARADAVANLRDRGASWAEIGAAFGVTRQAAMMRYNPKPAPAYLARHTSGACKSEGCECKAATS